MKEKSERIRERESWLKVGVIIFFSLVLGIPLFWKLITGDLQIDLSNLKLESILTVVISFFAIYLSILFYLKANESSNHFYNNSYSFTKDISETLRGIEAGFGEKLKNIDKGYEDFRRSFETYISPLEKVEIKKEVEEEKKKLKEIISEKDNIISELEKKSNLSKQDINHYLKQIKDKELELRDKNLEIQSIKNQLIDDNSINENQYYTFRKYLKLKFFPEISKEILDSDRLLTLYFRKLSNNFSSKFMNEMHSAGFMRKDGKLTQKGIALIRQVVEDL